MMVSSKSKSPVCRNNSPARQTDLSTGGNSLLVEKTQMFGLIIGFLLLAFLKTITAISQVIMYLANRFFYDDQKPNPIPIRIAEKDALGKTPLKFDSIDDLCGQVRSMMEELSEKHPVPKNVDFKGCNTSTAKDGSNKASDSERIKISFQGCSNLTVYNLGVAHALSKSDTFRKLKSEKKIQITGGSSGAYVGMCLAMEFDLVTVFEHFMTCFVRQKHRLGGCIGMYYRELRWCYEECYRIHYAKKEGDVDNFPHEILSDDTFSVFLTRFNPSPEFITENAFTDKNDIIDAVLSSSYIPVAFEKPICYKDYGLIVDGCLTAPPLIDGIVIGPYKEQIPDIGGPEKPFPTAIVFNIVHPDDCVYLFQKGYLDCLKWMESGCKSRVAERNEKFKDSKLGVLALTAIGFGAVLEIAGFERETVRGFFDNLAKNQMLRNLFKMASLWQYLSSVRSQMILVVILAVFLVLIY